MLFGLCKSGNECPCRGSICWSDPVRWGWSQPLPRKEVARCLSSLPQVDCRSDFSTPQSFPFHSKPLSLGRRTQILLVLPSSNAYTDWPYLLIFSKLILFFVPFLLKLPQPEIPFLSPCSPYESYIILSIQFKCHLLCEFTSDYTPLNMKCSHDTSIVIHIDHLLPLALALQLVNSSVFSWLWTPWGLRLCFLTMVKVRSFIIHCIDISSWFGLIAQLCCRWWLSLSSVVYREVSSV